MASTLLLSRSNLDYSPFATPGKQLAKLLANASSPAIPRVLQANPDQDPFLLQLLVPAKRYGRDDLGLYSELNKLRTEQSLHKHAPLKESDLEKLKIAKELGKSSGSLRLTFVVGLDAHLADEIKGQKTLNRQIVRIDD